MLEKVHIIKKSNVNKKVPTGKTNKKRYLSSGSAHSIIPALIKDRSLVGEKLLLLKKDRVNNTYFILIVKMTERGQYEVLKSIDKNLQHYISPFYTLEYKDSVYKYDSRQDIVKLTLIKQGLNADAKENSNQN